MPIVHNNIGLLIDRDASSNVATNDQTLHAGAAAAAALNRMGAL